MEILNATPFTPLLFESQDVDGDDFFVFVLKGTFEIVQGSPLKPCVDQAPLVVADEYHGDPLASSVRVESDVVPMKYASDITVEAVAHAPESRPARYWTVGVEVGRLRKELRVTGPRFWRPGVLTGWSLDEPEKTLEVPLRYERAFGGTYWRDQEPFPFEANPVGKGHFDPRAIDRRKTCEAPQIEALDDPITVPGLNHEPQGFGPIAKHWVPRRNLCGTADEAWLAERWPKLPKDFDFAYYNGAHPDLIYPGMLRGDESVTLENLHPRGTTRFQLPGYQFDVVAIDTDDYAVRPAMFLDTFHIDMPNLRAFLVWRGTFLKQAALRHVKSRLVTPAAVSHA